MKIAVLIPARLNSSRLLRKNIRLLKGKPLINWTIDVLLESECFSDITVSTESQIIIDEVRKYYSESEVKIIRRPESLALDDSPIREVVRHYLENRPEIDWVGVLLPTFPFRKVSQLKKACNMIQTAHTVKISAATMDEAFSRDLYYEAEEGFRHFFREPGIFCRYASASYTFHHRDFTPEKCIQLNRTIFEHNFCLNVDFKENIDIDTEEDFNLAERFAPIEYIVERKLAYYEVGDWCINLPEGIDLHLFLNFIGKKLLQDSSKPILILEKASQMITQFHIHDGTMNRLYFACEKAQRLRHPTANAVKTQNMQYNPDNFKQSIYYRVFPKRGMETILKNPICIEDMLVRPENDAEQAIPHDRVIHMKDLEKQEFYRDPFIIESF
jgi:CMP-N-acetylneuraminic acid synthetase